MALDVLAGGRLDMADPLLRMVKWEMNEAARERLVTLLNAAKTATLLHLIDLKG
jgi:hypothetical protein